MESPGLSAGFAAAAEIEFVEMAAADVAEAAIFLAGPRVLSLSRGQAKKSATPAASATKTKMIQIAL
jgi:hypothetical protein